MATVSFGTITITDTNDIESIVVEYNRNQSTTTPPAHNDSGWSTNRPAWAQGYYIWQRTRIHKSGTDESSDIFGDAVCLTGSTGQKGDALEISSVKYAISEENSFVDEEPYTFRPSLGGTRLKDEIVGGTVAWNQKSPTKSYSVQVSSDAFKLSTLATLDSVSIDHKILYSVDVSLPVNGTVRLRYPEIRSQKTVYANTLFNYSGIVILPSDSLLIGIQLYQSSGEAVTGNTNNRTVIDLTQMFGTAIADYIYSLEQATEGAGVAWLKKYSPKMFSQYNAYNAGELMSVSGLQSHDMTGFNQWDEVWELGSINTSGINTDSTTSIRSVNYIPALPNTAYYYKFSGTMGVRFYDANKNFISYTAAGNSIKTTPDKCCYMRFVCLDTTSYDPNVNPICINLARDNSRNGEYEPYELHSYPLDTDLTLRGIPKLDANNNLYYDGDTYEADGIVTRKYGIVDLGSFANSKYDTSAAPLCSINEADFKAIVKKPSSNSIKANIICTKYIAETRTNVANLDKTISINNGGVIVVNDSAMNDKTAAQFKESLDGVYLVYELTPPITETADSYTNPQIVDDFGTEEYVTDSFLPVGHNTEYFTGTTDQPADSEFTYDAPPNVKDGQWLWVRTTYSDNTKVYLKTRQGIEGLPGTAGRGITDVETLYATNNSTTTAPTSGWQTQPPTYDSSKPKYWVKVTTIYDSGDPTIVTYLDNGITDAMSTAAAANSTANTANQNASTALTNANTALTNANNALSIANGTKQWFWAQATDYSTAIPAGTYVTQIGETSFKNSPSGGNVLTRSDGIYLRNGGVTLGSLTGTALTFYKPNTTNKGMELTTSALTFYNPSNNTAQLIIGANGTLQSGNYNRGSDSKFSSNGTKIDLINGDIITKYFRVSQGLESGLTAGVYVHGTIEALDGTIGTDSINYWEIGNGTDYNLSSTAKMIGHGSSYIQLGDSSTWRLATNRIHTGWYTSSDSLLHFPAISSKYWDFGIHAPDSATDKFLYIRSSKANTSASTALQNLLYDIDDSYATPQWDYKFYIDGSGNLYAKNLYFFDENNTPVQVGGADGVYLPKTGGTITGNLTVNGTITGSLTGTASNAAKVNNLTVQTAVPANALFTDKNVRSTQANTTKIWLVGTSTSGDHTGEVNYDSNVYLTTTAGTLHATTFDGDLSGTATKANQDGDGNVIKTTYLKLSGGNVTGAVTFGSSVSIDELTAGDLVVNGNTSFTNNISANTINGVAVGDSPRFTDSMVTQTATTTSAAYEVLFSYTADNTTRTESARKTSTLTYNPSTKELTIGTVKIKEASTGFTISGGTTSKTLTVGGDYTLAAAAAKGVVTSIDTSANLPTSNAVKTFVEGKGYITANHTSTYSLPLAASGTRGGVQIGYTQSGKNYPVQLSSEKMYVNVPWENTTYTAGDGLDLSSNKFSNYRGIEYICGTWAEASGTWTGVSTDSALYDGKQIILYMPFAGSGNATLNLTLADGTTTGAKNVYFESSTRFTTHKGQNSQLHLIYHESLTLSDGNAYSGWWYVANRDTNTNDTAAGYTRFSHGTFITTTAVGRYVICLTKSLTEVVPVTAVNNSTATTKTLTTDTFNPFEPIFYYTNNAKTAQTAADTALSASYLWRNYSNINLSYSFNTGTTLVNNKDVFIKATPTNGHMATLASTPIVQDLPTTDDGFIYIKLGHACSTSNIAMSYEHPIYWYKNGAVRPYGGDAATVTGKTPLFEHQDISGKADKSATVSTITYDSTNNKITKTINGTTTDVVTVATIKSAIGSLKNPNAIKINVYSGTNTATTTTYDGSTANQSVDVASSNAITGVSASAAAGGSTTFTLTKANGDTSTFDVTVTASVATGATTITDASGNAVSKGSATKPVYFSNGVPAEANTYAGGTAVTLNGSSKASSTASFYAPTGAGTAKQILVSTAGTPGWQTVATGGTNGTIKIGSDEYAVKGLAAAAYKALADSSSASAIGTGTNVTTERDVYYGLPTINNAHNYTSSTTIYAPTAGGTSSQVLIGNGTTSAPVWTDISGLVPSSATNATNDSDGNPINTTYLKKSGGTMTGGITFGNADNAWNDKGVLFTNGSRIGEDTNSILGLYGTKIVIRPNSTASNSSDGVEISGSGLYPTNNNSETLGTSSHKWSNVYATTFNGALSGNATSATKANLTTTANAVAYYTDTAGTFGSKASANGALYATSTNGELTFGTLPIAQGGTGATNKRAAGLIYDWTANIQGQQWSRICYIPVSTTTVGSNFFLNVRGTRSSVVYNYTFNITVSHDSGTHCDITTLSGSSYSSLKIRGVTDSGGNCYIELYDSARDIALGTTQKVYCHLYILTKGTTEPTLYTTFTDGTTIESGFIANELNLVAKGGIQITGNFYGNLKGNADTATSAGKWTTAQNFTIKDSDSTNSGTAVSVDGSAAVTLLLPSTIKASLTGNASTATKWTSAQTVYVTLGTASTTTTVQGGSSSAQTIGVNGTLAIGNGGTGLTASPSMLTNLGSTTAANVLQASPRPGVTGTLGIGNGGTGATTAGNAINALLGGLPTWTANPTDTTYFIRQDTAGAASYGKATFSTLWNYISGKISSSNTYVTIATDQTITAAQKTFNGATRWSITNSTTGSKYGACNYDSALDALVFSFGTI